MNHIVVLMWDKQVFRRFEQTGEVKSAIRVAVEGYTNREKPTADLYFLRFEYEAKKGELIHTYQFVGVEVNV